MVKQFLLNKNINNFIIKNIILLSLMLSAFSAFSQFDNYIPLLKIGEKAPDFKLTSTKYKTVNLSDYIGEMVVLDFWYIGCAPCMKAHEQIIEVQQEIGNDCFKILGMNSINRKGQIRRFIRKHDYKNTNIYCSKNIANTYMVEYYPTIYIVNKEGVIIYANSTFSPVFKEGFKEVILIELQNNILKEKKNNNKNPFHKVFKN